MDSGYKYSKTGRVSHLLTRTPIKLTFVIACRMWLGVVAFREIRQEVGLQDGSRMALDGIEKYGDKVISKAEFVFHSCMENISHTGSLNEIPGKGQS